MDNYGFFDIEKAAFFYRDRIIEWRKANSSWFVPSSKYINVETWFKPAEVCLKYNIDPEKAVDAIMKYGNPIEHTFPTLNMLRSEKVLLKSWNQYKRHMRIQKSETHDENTLHMLEEEVECYVKLLRGMVKKYGTTIETLLRDETVPLPDEVRVLLSIKHEVQISPAIQKAIDERLKFFSDFKQDFERYIEKHIPNAKRK